MKLHKIYTAIRNWEFNSETVPIPNIYFILEGRYIFWICEIHFQRMEIAFKQQKIQQKFLEISNQSFL